MKLGLGSFAYFWSGGVPGWPQPAEPMTPLGLVERAAALGLRLVQIADNMPVDGLDRPGLGSLKERAEALGIEVELGTRGIQGGNIERHIALCQFFNSRVLRIVVDTADHHPSPDDVVRIVSEQVSSLKDAGVVLAIENHDRFPAPTLAAIIRRIDSPHVGVCLDTVNSFGSLEGPEAVLAELAPLVVSLHLKDFTIRRASHMMGFVIEGTPAGDGKLNVPWLLDRLRSAGRDVNAILELWPPPAERIEDTVVKEDEWAVRSVRNLRALIPD
ncbi:MAG: sugar phosphate isomerase/epimerase [Betaproteobacteria bacterium]|nr:sugar phosphate isomerase/epimerase [Betaproteobacteria bacterium]